MSLAFETEAAIFGNPESLMERATILETMPAEIIETVGNSCDDCPEVNPKPPTVSECPYFNNDGPFPVCERPGSLHRKLVDDN